MNIIVCGLDRKLQRSVQNVIQLFYEDAEISFAQEDSKFEQAKVQLCFQIRAVSRQETEITVMVEDLKQSGHVIKESETIPSDLNNEEDRRKLKHAVNRPLLKALEQLTGMKQPWGVLTGIRPTKLMHRYRMSGVPSHEAKAQLKEQYRIEETKMDLMHQITGTQLEALPDLYDLKNEVSIYIGIPYCPTKCAYCTFPAYSIFGRQGDVDSFLGGLHYEMRETGRWLKEKGIRVTTIYFGGGTPTSITAEEMDRLYAEMAESFPDVDKVREVTVEAGRPDTITPEKLNVLRKWGIDRISINPQSYTQETLQAIGRHHTVEETIEKYHLARQMGMNNINMDLIIGLPGETLEHFEHTLEQTRLLMPDSLTVHTLSFKKASEMTRNKQKYPVAGREEIQAMMNEAESWTAKHHYQPYYLYRQKNILGNLENVGYAMPGKESLYNIVIMEEMQTIIGIGCGAASKFVHPVSGVISRIANPKEPKAYNERFKDYTEKKLAALEELFG